MNQKFYDRNGDTVEVVPASPKRKIEDVIVNLTAEQLGWLDEILRFRYRVNKIFFDDENYWNYFNGMFPLAEELNNGEGNYIEKLKIFKGEVSKLLNKTLTAIGNVICVQLIKKIRRCEDADDLEEVNNWVFSIKDLYYDGIYDWMI